MSYLEQLKTSSRRHHAYLLVGHEAQALRGQVQQLARQFLCPESCGQCLACRNLDNHPDFRVLENSLDHVRALLAQVFIKPLQAPCRVIAIYEADALSSAVQNALLKTLEEPPPATHFLLTTTRVKELKLTLRSRCHKLRVSSPQTGIVVPEELRASLLSVGDPLRLAAELGADKERADLALVALEQLVVEKLSCGAPAFGKVAEALTALRLQAPKHFNRTLALDNLLLSWQRALGTEQSSQKSSEL